MAIVIKLTYFLRYPLCVLLNILESKLIMLTYCSDTENSTSSGAPCLLEKTKGVCEGKVKLAQLANIN